MMQNKETKGMVLGFMAIAAFSVTLPATRLAVREIHPSIIGFGRSVVAGIVAALILFLTHQRRPTLAQLKSLVIVASGVVLGFPFLSAWAMKSVHASHGAVLIGILPLATAAAGALRAGDRPSFGFWITATLGSAIVIGFSVIQGAGKLQTADLLLLIALLLGAIGYAEGGRLARELGGWQVICWALVISMPISSPMFVATIFKHGFSASLPVWLCFSYVSLISQLFGFFIWYHALAIGGVARVGQVQLVQPFLTMSGSAILLGEKLDLITIGAACLVVLTLLLGRKTAVRSVTPLACSPALAEPFDRRAQSA
jgi:drug/metabolite transporter (DMT)-like permease